MGSHDLKKEIAFSGKRVRQKMSLALALSSLIPLLILCYVFYTYFMPLLDPVAHSRDLLAVSAILVFMALLMAGGGFIIYDIGSALTRAASMVTEAKPGDALKGELAVVERTDEIGTLMASFTKMMSTIEQQSQEITNFPSSSTSSPARPSRTRSPACPTARSSWTVWRTPSPGRSGAPSTSRCCSWTSIASRWSTTASAMAWGTRC